VRTHLELKQQRDELARRTAELAITDRISLRVQASGQVADAVRTHRHLIADEVLATELTEGAPDGAGFIQRTDVGGEPVGIGISRA